MTIYFLQPFPETRPLSSEEAHVFKVEGGGIFIINGAYKNKEDALHYFGERLGVTLSSEGSEVVPDYYFADNTASECTRISKIRYPRLRQEVARTPEPRPNRATEYRIRVLVIAGQLPSAITRLLQPDDPAAKQPAAIEDLDGHPRAVDEPRPSAERLPETAVPRAAKDNRASNSTQPVRVTGRN